MKRCSTCKEEKELSQFYKDKKQKDGLNNRCKKCSLAAQRKWREANLDRARQLTREADARYRAKHGNTYYNEVKRLKKYGITKEQLAILAEKYDGKCHICKVKDFEAIDHCHETNRVRGLLCRDCNFGLGLFRDDKDILARAISYLE